MGVLLFIIYMNDFKQFIRNSQESNYSSLRSRIKVFALVYPDDTVLMSGSELDMHKAFDATAEYYMENNMKINVIL